MELNDREKLMYLNNPKYDKKDKYAFMKCYSTETIEEIYSYCADLKNYVKMPDGQRVCYYKFPEAQKLLRNELDIREWEKSQKNL